VKPKVYISGQVSLCGVPEEHRQANGGRQFFIVCLTTSKKRLAHILGCTRGDMEHYGAHVSDQPQHTDRAGQVDEIRYRVEHAKSGSGWFTWKRPCWLGSL